MRSTSTSPGSPRRARSSTPTETAEDGRATRGRSWTCCGSAGSRRRWTGTSSTFPRYCCAARPGPSTATGAWSWSTWTGSGAASGPSTCKYHADTRKPPDANAAGLLLRGWHRPRNEGARPPGTSARQAHHGSPEHRQRALRRRVRRRSRADDLCWTCPRAGGLPLRPGERALALRRGAGRLLERSRRGSAAETWRRSSAPPSSCGTRAARWTSGKAAPHWAA